MEIKKYTAGKAASLFVKDILVVEGGETGKKTILHLVADGFPGLLFHNTPNGKWAQPHNKKMPSTYLYGQTLEPMELHVDGTFRMIGFQLFPFVLNRFFNVNPKELKNDCFDLSSMQSWNKVEKQLFSTDEIAQQIEIIGTYLYELFISHKEQLDFVIRDSLALILDNNSQITVNELAEKSNLTIRTLQRKFIKEVGVSPKDFIQITRFQESFKQLAGEDYAKLTDIVYANGFADQSHFIRVFKTFAGKTPSNFANKGYTVLSHLFYL